MDRVRSNERSTPLSRPLVKERNLVITLMLAMMLCGWAEGSIGPLLPLLRDYYSASNAVLSLYFVMGFVGAMVAGGSNVYISDIVGFAIAAPIGAVFQATAYILMASRLPLWAFVSSSALGGFGLTLQVNNIASRLDSASSSLYYVQACFAVGATIGPFFSTAWAQRFPSTPYTFFFLPAAVALFTGLQMFYACHGITEDHFAAKEVEVGGPEERTPLLADSSSKNESHTKMGRIFRHPGVYCVMLWSALYSGVEVTLSSYMTSFLIAERGGSTAVGNATTAFWAAMTISRAGWIRLNPWLGYSRAILLYSTVAGAILIMVGLIPRLDTSIAGFVMVGLFLGPLYPNALMVVSQTVDSELRGGVIGLMGCMGGAGGAVMPMIVGAIADKYGFRTFIPAMLVLNVLSFSSWAISNIILRRWKSSKSTAATQ